MDNPSAIDWDEMFEYLPGTVVELKKEPGIPRKIDYYEATMVPAIWLIDNPRPHYQHELRILFISLHHPSLRPSCFSLRTSGSSPSIIYVAKLPGFSKNPGSQFY